MLLPLSAPARRSSPAQDSGDNFYAPDGVQQVLTVNPATPALTLPTASSINYGQSLAASTLSNGGAVLGTNVLSRQFCLRGLLDCSQCRRLCGIRYCSRQVTRPTT